jgi:hypothetical protein
MPRRPFQSCFLLLSIGLLIAKDSGPLSNFHPSGLTGEISDATVAPAADAASLPPNFVSPDIDLQKMAAWSLRFLNRNPRPSLDYEPVFYVRPLHVPPAPEGHDPIVPGDTDTRMDWEYRNMRAILHDNEPGEVERRLHARVLGYLGADGLAWVPPGHFMEGDVYAGTTVSPQKIASTWATAKILRSLAEDYKQSRNEQTRLLAQKLFLALKSLASWDTGRAYYPFGSGAWRDGKWLKAQLPTAVLEPVVTYWEATGDPDSLAFARDVAEGLLADSQLLPPAKERILPNGEFRGHMHATLHAVWGVAHLGADTHESRYVNWAKQVYDYATHFGPGTGWMQAALWDDNVRELSETCATSDMTSIASLLAEAGFPEYWDHVERYLRNYIRPQQFFVTARYEQLYRKVNQTEPAAAVEAGLTRMRDLQGADMGGPAPNDWINWIASPKECGPYQTPWGCMGLFGCCAPEGMRALHTAWAGIIQSQNNRIFINESLTRSDPTADVISSLPNQGRIDVVAHRPGDYLLRPPHWVPRTQVHLLRSGRMSKIIWDGPGMAYVLATGVKPGDVLALSYPLVHFKEVWGNWPSQPNLKLTILWSGNSVLDIQPKGKGLPIDFAHMPAVPAIQSGTGE